MLHYVHKYKHKSENLNNIRMPTYGHKKSKKVLCLIMF